MSLKAWQHNASFKNSEARTRSRPGFFAHFRPDLREQVDAAQLQKEVASVVVRCFQPTLCQDGNELRHRVQIDSSVQARMVRTAVAILHATYPTKFGSAVGTSHMAACIRPFGRHCTSWTPPVQCFHECLFDSLSCLTLPALIRKCFRFQHASTLQNPSRISHILTMAGCLRHGVLKRTLFASPGPMWCHATSAQSTSETDGRRKRHTRQKPHHDAALSNMWVGF